MKSMIETFWIIASYISMFPAGEATISQYGKEIPLTYESQQACNQQILDLKYLISRIIKPHTVYL